MLLSSFQPRGPTYLVDATARNVPSTDGSAAPCYRVRNLSASAQYFTHGIDNTVTNQGAPAGGAPSFATIGMLPLSTEVFSGLGPWMIASSATGFEVTPGEGI